MRFSKHSRKGVALNIIAGVIIAIAGISLLILTYTGILPEMFRNAYCQVYPSLVSVLPSPEEGMPSPPDFCREKLGLKEKRISSAKVDEISRQLAGYSLVCWEKARRLGLKTDYLCYSIDYLTPKSKRKPISEKNVTQALKKEGGCRVLENSKIITPDGNLENFKCGKRDKIDWKAETALCGVNPTLCKYIINLQTTIQIRYNSTSDKVEIIA